MKLEARVAALTKAVEGLVSARLRAALVVGAAEVAANEEYRRGRSHGAALDKLNAIRSVMRCWDDAHEAARALLVDVSSE